MCVYTHMCMCVSCSVMSDFVTPRTTVAHQAPLSMEFSRLGYWSGLPCTLPGDLPNPGVELRSLALQADSLLSELPGNLPSISLLSTYVVDAIV